LAELDNLYQQSLDSNNDAIRIISNDFIVLRINKAFAEIAGVDQNAVMGKEMLGGVSQPPFATRQNGPFTAHTQWREQDSG
jgi:PAS domain S-box-containing protein